MSSTLSGLNDLHALQQQCEELEQQLSRGPHRVKARQNIVATRQTEVDSEKEQLLNLRKTADEKALQLKSNEAKILDLRAKLNTADTNREFDIIKGQIEADTAANSVLEDEILETLEAVDSAEEDLQKREVALRAAEDEVESCQAEVDSQRPGLKSSIEGLKEQIKVAEQIVPTQHREVYQRLVSAHGAGALAELVGGACTACHHAVAAQDRVQLNVGKIVFCRSCGRLLYIGADAS